MNESRLVPLGELSGDPAAPTVIRLDETVAVVLDRPTPVTVDIWRDGDVFQHADSELVAVITDLPQWQSTVRQALLSLSFEYQQAAAGLVADTASYEAKLADVREYAIDRHRERIICRDGLDEFLDEFDLAPYDPRIEVTFSLSGSYEVEGDDVAAARRHGETHLKVDIVGICSAAGHTLSYSTEIQDVTSIGLAGTQPRLRVRYRISGAFRIISDDVDHAEMDVIGTLRASMSEVPRLVPDSAISDEHLQQLAFHY